MAKTEKPIRIRSGGYRVFHGTLCVIGTLLLLFCFSNTVSLRSYCRTNALSSSLRASRLSDAKIPFTGKNVTDYILSGYVTDSNVLPEDIETAVDEMNIPAFLADKIEMQMQLLHGDSNEPVQVTPEEISGELDRISEQLHASCRLIIEDSDRAQIDSALQKPLAFCNGISSAFGGTKAGRAFQRFGVSIFAYILEIVLFLLLLFRWRNIRKCTGKDSFGALKGMGLTLLIPSALSLLFVIIGGAGTWFVQDGVTGLYPFWKALRAPYWWTSVTVVSFSLFLLELCAFLRVRAKYKASAPAKEQKSPVMPSAPEVPAAKASEEQKYCISCGKSIPRAAKFCIYCGAGQQTASEQPDPIPQVRLEKEPESTEPASDSNTDSF